MSLMINSSDRSVRRRRTEDEISLPEDLLPDILWRISGQSIFEFRRLSKYYKQLIESDNFIRHHYDLSIKERATVILHNNRRTKVDTTIHLDFELDDFKVDNIKPPFMDGGMDLHFLGCCRGILCYQVDNYLMFWNPFTNTVRRSRCTDTDPISWQYNKRFFFGHDIVTNDLKVLKIARRGYDQSTYVYGCVVYSSKTDSWTTTKGFGHLRNYMGYRLHLGMEYPLIGKDVFVEGSNCVYILGGGDRNIDVLAYDFRAEEFNVVPLPQKYWTKWDISLLSLDGCLCLASSWASCLHVLKVWMMKDNKWSLLFCIDDSVSYPESHIMSSGFAVIHGRPHLLVATPRNGLLNLYVYDYHKKQFNSRSKKYHIQMELDHDVPPHHFLYTPTLRKP